MGASRFTNAGKRLVARWFAPPRLLPAIVLTICGLLLLFMYSFNTDWGGDPTSPRGDGKYRPILARGDGHVQYLITRSLVFDHDLIYDNDLARFGDPWRLPRTKTGRKMIPQPVGPSLVHAPFMILAHGLSKVANLFGAEIPAHGYTMFHQRIVFFTSVLFAFGTALLGLVTARRLIGGRYAPLYGAVAVLFGTSITYYATHMPSYAHAMDAFACAGFVAYWIATFGQLHWKRFVLLGVLLGLCALVRITGFAFGLVIAIELIALMIQKAPREQLPGGSRVCHCARLVARGSLVLVIALIVFVPQLVAWKVVFGDYLVSPMGSQFVRLDHPQILETLFSSRNGWLSSHPIAYLGVVGLFVAPRRAG